MEPSNENDTQAQFKYEQFMQGEGIPIYRAASGVDDVTALPRRPWARTGGLGTFIELLSTFQSERGMFVCEIPGGKSLAGKRAQANVRVGAGKPFRSAEEHLLPAL
jgi:hypothetical protein